MMLRLLSLLALSLLLAAPGRAAAGLEPTPPANAQPPGADHPEGSEGGDEEGDLLLEEEPGEETEEAPEEAPGTSEEAPPLEEAPPAEDGESEGEPRTPPPSTTEDNPPAQPQPTESLGVFEVTMVGLDPALQETAIDALATTIAELRLYKVISRRELLAMISAEMMKQSMGCDDPSCAAELGSAAGVERLVTGSISKVQRALEISLQIVNTRFATVENRVTLTWNGPIEQLSDVLAAAAELLVLPAKARKPGAVQISGVPPDARVTLNGQLRGSGPVTIGELPVGVHDLQVESEGYELYQAPVVVRSGQNSLVPVRLQHAPEKPFYATWWFWTIVGGVAASAAGVTTAVVVGTSSPPPPPQGTLVIGAPVPGRSGP